MRWLLAWCAAACLLAATPSVTGPVSVTGTLGVPRACAIVASDEPTHYAAIGLPSTLGLDPLTGFITGTPTTAGSYTVSIAATNGSGTGSSSFTLTIEAAATPVLANAGAFLVSAGSGCRIALAATGATDFTAIGLPFDLSIDNATGVISGNPSTAETLNIAITVSDGAITTSGNLVIRVLEADPQAPVFPALDAPAASVGAPFAYALAAPGATTYTATGLPDGLAFDAASGVIQGTPTAAGTANIRISASGTGGAASVLGLAIATPAADAPVPATGGVLDGTVDSSLAWQAGASAAATYALSTTPAGLAFDPASGMLDGIPTAPGLYNLILACANPDTLAIASTSLVVRIGDVDADAPVLGPFSPPVVTVGAPMAMAIPVDAPASITASGLPAGLSLVAGILSGTPTAAGRKAVRLVATSPLGSAVSTLTVDVVAATAGAPLPTGGLSFRATVGSTFSACIAATPTAATTVVGGLPDGLSADPVTGLITGTPLVTAIGAANLQVSCLDGGAASNATVALVRVAAQATPDFTLAGPLRLTAGVACRCPVAATSATGLPAGLAFDAATGVISGTPTAAGPANVVLSRGAMTTTLAVLVEAAVPGLVIADPGRVDAIIDRPLAIQLTASGTPLLWSATGLPAGLGIDAVTGRITGTPTDLGSSAVAITASDGVLTSRTVLLIRVSEAAPPAPVPDGPAPSVSGVSGGCGAGGAAGLLLLALSLRNGRRRTAARRRSP